jgi:hypothetical protein
MFEGGLRYAEKVKEIIREFFVLNEDSMRRTADGFKKTHCQFNVQINKAVYTGKFNILEFIEYADSEELKLYYHEYKRKNCLLSYNLNLTYITDIFLKKNN